MRKGGRAMLKQELNELLTRTGPQTPMGELFRQYWLPALLAEELPESDSPPVRVLVVSGDEDDVPELLTALRA
jgi:hypothetical protein